MPINCGTPARASAEGVGVLPASFSEVLLKEFKFRTVVSQTV
jgi:hypothetical protein